jgi:hypothetical protein
MGALSVQRRWWGLGCISACGGVDAGSVLGGNVGSYGVVSGSGRGVCDYLRVVKRIGRTF